MQITATQAGNIVRKHKHDISFYTDILKEDLWEKQLLIITKIKDGFNGGCPTIVVTSCHASGKTYVLGDIVNGELFPYKDSVVLTTAPTWKQVKNTLWRQIKRAYNRAERNKRPLGGSLIQTELNISETWYALGLSTSEPENFAGYHSERMLIVMDEASGVSDEIDEAVDGIAAGGLVVIVKIGNPTKINGHFARDAKRSDVVKITISCFDTPNFTANGIKTVDDLTLEKCQCAEVVVAGLITPMWVYRLKEKYGVDSDVFRVRALGKFPKAESDTFMSIDMVQDAINRTVTQRGLVIIGVDVARFGSDKSVVTVRQGMKVIEKFVYEKIDTMELVGNIINDTSKYQDKVYNVDVIGVGAGVGDRLKEQGFKVNMVNVAEKPNEKVQDDESMPNFGNLRAEAYFRTKDALKYLDLPEDDDWFELCNLKYKFDSAGRLFIESKDEMKKRGLHSPDTADSLMLTFAKDVYDKGFDAEVDIGFA